MDKISTLRNEAVTALQSATDPDSLEALRLRYLGRKSELIAILRGLGQLPPDQRGAVGKEANAAKTLIEELLDQRLKLVKQNRYQALADQEWIDVTLPGATTLLPDKGVGHLHPLTQLEEDIIGIFQGMGFEVFSGPQAEDDFHNFEGLNIPADHPARDMQDTFWLKGGHLLRTHTSSVQIRTLEKRKPPLRGIAPGRVFRHEATDASHESTFYQVEGLLVDRNVSVAHLIYTMKTFLREVFRREVEVRLRPGYFPFVEPGFELDIRCLICSGQGCSVCKQVGWVELLPCGLVHPRVLELTGHDPKEWNGFAFGLGLNRLVMMRYGITDIRHFQAGDLRFLEQF